MLAFLVFVAAAAAQTAVVPLETLTCRQLVAQMPPVSGEMLADPGTGAIRAHPVVRELRRRIEAGERIDADSWTTIMLERGYLRQRERWPLDRPFAVALRAPAFAQGFEIELVPREPGWRAAHATHWEMMCGLGMASLARSESYQQLGNLRPDQREFVFDLDIRVPRSSRASSTVEEHWARVATLRIDVEPVASIDDVLEPTDVASWGAEIAATLSLDAGMGASGLKVSWLHSNVTLPPELACNLEVTLTGTRARPQPSDLWLGDSHASAEVPRLEPQITWGRKPATGLSLRLRGTSANVLRNWDATHYWTGELEIPVAELVERRDRRDDK